MRITKNGYLKAFGVTVIILALVRCLFPSVAPHTEIKPADVASIDTDTVQNAATAIADTVATADLQPRTVGDVARTTEKAHPVIGVPNYDVAFPDSNDVQLATAKKYGIEPITTRDELQGRRDQLVYVGGCPFYYMDPLKRSMPYLVPRASLLLYDIGRNFLDSLQIKKLPLHQLVVTSVLRSRDDLQTLSQSNGNVSENSCHLYATTFDVSYNRYKVVADPDGPKVTETRNDTLKYVLCEVLNDLRQNNRCYVKYERKQGCFHITVR